MMILLSSALLLGYALMTLILTTTVLMEVDVDESLLAGGLY